MALKVSDYPMSQYDGYFEILDRRSDLAARYEAQMRNAVAGNADAMEAAAKLKRELDAAPSGSMLARVYGKVKPSGIAGHAKEFAHAVIAEHSGPPEEVEAFVAAEMAKIKKAVQ